MSRHHRRTITCHHPRQTPIPSEQLPKYICYTTDFFERGCYFLTGWNTRHAATGTDLFVHDSRHNFLQTPPHVCAGAEGNHVLPALINPCPTIVMLRPRCRPYYRHAHRSRLTNCLQVIVFSGGYKT
jgi:hypothetical protein